LKVNRFEKARNTMAVTEDIADRNDITTERLDSTTDPNASASGDPMPDAGDGSLNALDLYTDEAEGQDEDEIEA
jgi:hypothetical protein